MCQVLGQDVHLKLGLFHPIQVFISLQERKPVKSIKLVIPYQSVRELLRQGVRDTEKEKDSCARVIGMVREAFRGKGLSSR